MAATIATRLDDNFHKRVEQSAKQSGMSPAGYMRFLLQIADSFTPRYFELMIRDLSERYGVSEGFIVESTLSDLWAKVLTDSNYKPSIFHKSDDGRLLRGRELLDWLKIQYQQEKAEEFFNKD